MQRVVRSTFIGLLACAALTACGDKTEVVTPTTTPVQTSTTVSVTPPSATLNVGDQITLVATVTPGTGITDRTVTWASGNTAVATVDANSGVVKAVGSGSTTVTATSKGDPNAKAAVLITVNGGPGNGAVPTITVSTINQTNAAGNSVPANLGNVQGQIDVTFNVDAGSQKLSEVDLVMNCGAGDVVVAKQTLAASAIAAEAAAAPITLSFNTAAFDSTGAAQFRNGQCQLKGKAITLNGTVATTTTSTGTPITLANKDVLIGSVSSAKTAINTKTGLGWVGGNQTVTVIPVFYTPGRSAATVAVSLNAGATGTAFGTVTQTITDSTGGVVTATFQDKNDGKAISSTDIDGITNTGVTVTATVIDNSGQSFDNSMNIAGFTAGQLATQASVLALSPVVVPSLRLDTEKPKAGTFPLANNTDQNTSGLGYLGTNFRFAADSAAGFRGPDAVAGNQTQNLDARTGTNGVDVVTYQFLAATNSSGTLGTPAATTTTTALGESTTSTGFALMQIATDALGNADTAFANGTDVTSALKFNATNAGTNGSAFGVDLTAPTIKGATSNPANQATSNALGGTGSFSYTISDALSGPNPSPLIAQVDQNSGVTANTVPANGTVSTGAGVGCVIGRFTSAQPAASANALPVYSTTGSVLGYCTPVPFNTNGGNTPLSANVAHTDGYVTTTYIAIDQAGNQATPITTSVLEDATAPTVSALDLPGSLTGNSTVSFPATATDNLDLTSSVAAINYNAAGVTLQYAPTSGPGATFDNVLTTSASITPTVNNLITNLETSGAISDTTHVANNATSVTVAAIDGAGNAKALTGTFAPTVALPDTTKSAFPTNFSGWAVTGTSTTVSNCATSGCTGGSAAVNPTSTTLTATAMGPSQTFTNPFAFVQIWYQVNNAGPYFFAGTATLSGSRDNGVNRFWDYTFTFDPPTSSPVSSATGTSANLTTNGTAINIIAVGVSTSGNGIMTANMPVTLSNP